MKKQLLLILTLLLSLNALGQKIDKFPYTLYEGKYSNKDFFNKSEYIFEGEVLYTKNYLNEDTTRVLASSVVKVIHVFKGDLSVDTIEFAENGAEWWVRTDSTNSQFSRYDDVDFLFFSTRRVIFFAKKREERVFNDRFKIKLTSFADENYGAIYYSEDSDYNFMLYGLRDLYFKSLNQFQRYAKRQMDNKNEFKRKRLFKSWATRYRLRD